jgi:hypothetical protein
MAGNFKKTYTGFGWCSACGKLRALRQWLTRWLCRRCWGNGER